MAKSLNGAGSSKPISQKHLHSRVSYLCQAAAYLSSTISEDKSIGLSGHDHAQIEQLQSGSNVSSETPVMQDQTHYPYKQDRPNHSATPLYQIPDGLSRFYISQARSVARKSTIRLTPELKQIFCKNCNQFLAPAKTCLLSMENKSRMAAKPCADVMIVHCLCCQKQKRYPVGANRQPRKGQRAKKSPKLHEELVSAASDGITQPT